MLAIGAVKLGFDPVLGADADRTALDETLRNARANGAEVEVRHVDLRREPAPVADAVAANLTAGLCEAVARSWAERGARPGTAIMSGFLREEADRRRGGARRARGTPARRRRRVGRRSAVCAPGTKVSGPSSVPPRAHSDLFREACGKSFASR